MDFIFDEEKHQFIVDGQIWPSITQVLRSVGLIDGQWFTEYSRNRGTLVHRIIHWHIMGNLDDASIDPILRPYYDAWLSFERDTGFISNETEIPRISRLYRFGGIPDHIGILNGKEAIVDVKSGAEIPATALQTAAQEILVDKILPRYSLRLKDNGKYSLIPHTNRQDRQIFLSALAVWWWRKNNIGG